MNIKYRCFYSKDMECEMVEITCNGEQIDVIPRRELDNLYPEEYIRHCYKIIQKFKHSTK